MNSGKSRRLKRIFRKDGRALVVAMDHGVTLGPITGLENMRETIHQMSVGRADAVVIHKGIAQSVDVASRLGLIIHLSASTNLGPDASWKVQVCTVEEALRLGADAVSVHVNVGSTQEHQQLMKLGSVAGECERLGVPLLAMMYPRGPGVKSEHDPDAVKHASRVGVELGADIVKTPYTGSVETFREVVRGCPAPVLIAGGPKAKTDQEFLETVFGAMEAGAAGASVGRNVFQHQTPIAMVKAVEAIIHRKASVEEALRVLGEGR